MSGRQDGNAMYGLDEIVARLEALIGQPHVSEEYIRFRIDLLKAQWAVRLAMAQTAQSIPRPSPTRRAATDQRQPELPMPRPAIEPDTIPFDRGLLQSVFSAICRSAAQRGRKAEDMQRLAAAVEADPALLQALAGTAAFGPDMEALEQQARALRVSVDVLLFVGRALAAPFVAEAARRVATTRSGGSIPQETGGRCGICGSLPSFAQLRREDGRRILHCGLCGTTWEFTRLACPWCETADREALNVLRLSEGDPRWIETCESCGGYIKTVDERKLPLGETIIPVVEESATLHLDLLAEREGYIRRIPYVLSG
jgi:FdhE protein